MKKNFFVYIMFFLMLSGCSIQSDNFFEISFEQAENIISENVNFFVQELEGMVAFKNNKANCNFLSDDSSLFLDMNIITTGYFNQYKDEKFDINSDIHFWDKKGKKELWTSGSIENIYLDGKYFIRFSGMSVNMGKGNYESNLWFIIMENLGDKWINYESDKFDNIKNIKNNILFTINTLFSSSVFENIEQVTYEGNLAYKISLKDNIIDFINEQTNFEISGFDGIIIVKSEDQVDLKINNMEINIPYGNRTKTINIRGIIGGEKGEIIYSMEGENIDIIYDIHRKYTNINVTKNINYDKIWTLNTMIYPSQKREISKYNIKGDLSISPNFIYGSDLENEVKINIKCFYENFNGDNFEIKEPDSYILLDQVLGDEFSMKNFIGNK